MIVIARFPLARKLRAPATSSVDAFSASGMSTIRRSSTAVLVMYSRVSGIGKIHLRRIASASAGSDAAKAAAFSLSRSGSATMIAAFGKSLSAPCTMASNTGWVSLSERLMTPRTSEVAVCCSSDSLSSRVRACTSSNRRTFSIASRRFHERIEHRLQVERRTADDLEHVGGRGLLLQRLAQLVQQARVLDGNDGLVGEALDQLYLLVGEWADLLAVDNDSARQLGFLQHRDAKHGSGSGQLGDLRAREARRCIGIMRFVLDIGDLNRLFRRHRTPEGSSGAGTNYRVAPPLFGIERRRAMQRNRAKRFPFGLKQHAELRLADAHCVLQHGLEYRLQLSGGAGDDAQHLRSCRLPLERLGKAPRASASSRVRASSFCSSSRAYALSFFSVAA